MDKDIRKSRLSSKIKTAKDIPLFSDAQIEAYNSGYVDSLDEALAVLDETNKITIGHTKAFEENEKES